MLLFEYLKIPWAWDYFHINLYVITLIYGSFQNCKRNFWSNFHCGHLNLIHLGGSFSHFNFIWNFWDECMWAFDPSTYLTWGCDNSSPLNRISSRDSEVCGRKEGYSSLRWSSLSHVASFSEWCDHWTLRNLIFFRRVTRSTESRIRTGYSR